MKYSLNNVTLSSLAALFVASAFCMEAEKKVLTQEEKLAQGLSIFLTKELNHLDYKTGTCLSRVCKSADKVYKEIANQRKLSIEERVGKSSLHSRIWRRDGSAYAFLRYQLPPLAIGLFELGYDGNMHIKSGKCEKDAKLLTGFERPTFNENGDVCFYYLTGSEHRAFVMELSFSIDSEPCNRYCELYFGFLNEHGMNYFIELPVLLKSFFNSSSTVGIGRAGELLKLFNFKNTIIPDNYQECSSPDNCDSFASLPGYLQGTITAHWQAQKLQIKEPADLLPISLKGFIDEHHEQAKKENKHKKWYKK